MGLKSKRKKEERLREGLDGSSSYQAKRNLHLKDEAKSFKRFVSKTFSKDSDLDKESHESSISSPPQPKRSWKKLPRPSTTSLDHIFKFNFRRHHNTCKKNTKASKKHHKSASNELNYKPIFIGKEQSAVQKESSSDCSHSSFHQDVCLPSKNLQEIKARFQTSDPNIPVNSNQSVYRTSLCKPLHSSSGLKKKLSVADHTECISSENEKQTLRSEHNTLKKRVSKITLIKSDSKASSFNGQFYHNVGLSKQQLKRPSPIGAPLPVTTNKQKSKAQIHKSESQSGNAGKIKATENRESFRSKVDNKNRCERFSTGRYDAKRLVSLHDRVQNNSKFNCNPARKYVRALSDQGLSSCNIWPKCTADQRNCLSHYAKRHWASSDRIDLNFDLDASLVEGQPLQKVRAPTDHEISQCSEENEIKWPGPRFISVTEARTSPMETNNLVPQMDDFSNSKTSLEWKSLTNDPDKFSESFSNDVESRLQNFDQSSAAVESSLSIDDRNDDDKPLNTSTCSMVSKEFFDETGSYRFSEIAQLQSKNKKRKKESSSSKLLSPSCARPSTWMKNRSFFLRLTESRRKQHKREWESKKFNFVGERFSSVTLHDGTSSINDLAEELKEANLIIKSQESEIERLRKQINEALEGAQDEECLRVAAEIERVTAENESRLLRATLQELRDQMEEKEFGCMGGTLAERNFNFGSSCDPKVLPRKENKVWYHESISGDSAVKSALKDSSDQGYFSLPSVTDDTPATPGQTSSIYPSPFTTQPKPSGLPLTQLDRNFSCTYSPCTDRRLVVNTSCQTETKNFCHCSNKIKHSRRLSLKTTQDLKKDKKPHVLYRVSTFFAHAVLTTANLQYHDEQILNVERMLVYRVIPSVKEIFA